MWCVAPLEMNEGNLLGQGYNRPTGCSAVKGPTRDLLLSSNSSMTIYATIMGDDVLHNTQLHKL